VTPTFLTPDHHLNGVVLSVLIAVFSSYVALDLARRMPSHDRFSAAVWTIGGAGVMGTGIWSMHFVGMLAFSLPIALGYAPLTTAGSWVAAVAVSFIGLSIAAAPRLNLRTLLAGSAVMGVGICVMHYSGMAALRMAPGIVWDTGRVVASVAIACAASAAALLMFFGVRRLRGPWASAGQAAAAVLMGTAISGTHYTGMAAAAFPANSLCLSASGLGGQSLSTLIVMATVLLLSLTLFTSVLDARLQAKTTGLAHSLQGANDELRRLAFLDPLTGVANRALFDDRLQQAAARVDRAPASKRLALLFIDLDGFKPVNDSYGHAVGDSVLRQVAQRLLLLTRDTDTLARVGGDEFLLLMNELSEPQHAVGLAQRILACLEQPFDLPGRKVTLSCSIGVAHYPEHGHREKLIACADAAMYQAKRGGGAGCVVYEARMEDSAHQQLDLQEALRVALQQHQLHLHYQPKVDARTGQLQSVEALLRWRHPVRGPIGPAEFIPVAERFGLIVPMGNWVIDEVCRQLADWALAGHRLQVSINLSGHQLRHLDVVARLQQAMQRHHIAPDQIVCEITESVAMADLAATQRVVEQLSAVGIDLSIDDFGTGYSSLSLLRQLKFKELKIDRSFVKDIGTHADARAMVDAVLRLARALGLRVVAEGVETAEQQAVLVALGCDLLQGYYFSRPVAPQDLIAALQRPAPAEAAAPPALACLH